MFCHWLVAAQEETSLAMSAVVEIKVQQMEGVSSLKGKNHLCISMAAAILNMENM